MAREAKHNAYYALLETAMSDQDLLGPRMTLARLHEQKPSISESGREYWTVSQQQDLLAWIERQPDKDRELILAGKRVNPYNIKPRKLRKWFNNGVKAKPGRHTIFSHAKIKEICDNIDHQSDKVFDCTKDEELMGSVGRAYEEYLESKNKPTRKGKKGKDSHGVPEATMRRLVKAIEVRYNKTSKPNTQTEARYNALLCLRNLIAFYVMVKVLNSRVRHLELIMNFDSSTFLFAMNKLTVQYIWARKGKEAVNKAHHKKLLTQAIKMLGIISTAGGVGPMVFTLKLVKSEHPSQEVVFFPLKGMATQPGAGEERNYLLVMPKYVKGNEFQSLRGQAEQKAHVIRRQLMFDYIHRVRRALDDTDEYHNDYREHISSELAKGQLPQEQQPSAAAGRLTVPRDLHAVLYGDGEKGPITDLVMHHTQST